MDEKQKKAICVLNDLMYAKEEPLMNIDDYFLLLGFIVNADTEDVGMFARTDFSNCEALKNYGRKDK